MKRMKLMGALALVMAMGTASSAYGATALLREIEAAFIRIGEDLRPCVVNIDTKSDANGAAAHGQEGFEDFFKFFNIPTPQDPRSMPRRASGSGFVYDKEGHIITNSHVVAEADAIEVSFWNGEKLEATLVGKDPQTDIAVIKVEAGFDLPVAHFGDSDALKVGQFTIAAGSPRGLEGSFSFGHVTALGREGLNLPGLRFQNFVQTDAAINLGNSGGPLCNIDGEVVGINTAIVFGADSLGFAIPAATALKVIPVLISKGKVTRGYLGVAIDDAGEFAEAVELPGEEGAFIKQVVPDTPAARAGLKEYDVVLKVNGQDVHKATDLMGLISDIAPGEKAVLDVWRDGKSIQVEVQLQEFPEDTRMALAPPTKDVQGLSVRTLTKEIAETMGLEEDVKGVVVGEVEFDSPAEKAGIAPGDIITKVGKEEIATADEFHAQMAAQGTPGKSVLLRLLRGGRSDDVVILKVPEEQEPKE